MYDQNALRAEAALVIARKSPLRVLRITTERQLRGRFLAVTVMFTDLHPRTVKGRPGGRWKVHRFRGDTRKRLNLDPATKAELAAIYLELKMRQERVTGGIASTARILTEARRPPPRPVAKAKRGPPRIFAVTGFDPVTQTLSGFLDLGDGRTKAFTFDGALTRSGAGVDLGHLIPALEAEYDKALAASLF